MTGEEFLRRLQARADHGYLKGVGWVDDQSSVAKALRLMDEIAVEQGITSKSVDELLHLWISKEKRRTHK